LHLEDDPADAALVVAALKRSGLQYTLRRVDNQAEFVTALEEGKFDLILSDVSLPGFSGPEACRIVQDRRAHRTPDTEPQPEVPFIFVSGTIGEEMAIDMLKIGATDYVMKHRLARLEPAVRRALAEAAEREERRAAVRSRQQAESLFRSLFEHVTVGVAIVDPDRRLIRVNPALQRMLGCEEAELLTLGFPHFVHPDDAAEGEGLDRELWRGERSSYEVEQRFVCHDGEERRARTVVSAIREERGAPRYAIHLVEDVTERRAMEAHFLQAQKMEAVGRLAAGIAHDFNNLLTVINGYTGMMLRKGTPEQTKPLQAIVQAAERARTLTQRLLALGRQQQEQRKVLEVNAVLTGLEPMVRHLLGPGIHLILELDPAAGAVEVDETQIEQVLMNLVINSRDALGDEGRITLSTAAEPASEALPRGAVLVRVTDTGSGMDAATQARMFEPFFTTKDLGKGTGLGMWMVSEIVGHSGGSIAVDSALGKGTTVTIRLPQVQAATAA